MTERERVRDLLALKLLRQLLATTRLCADPVSWPIIEAEELLRQTATR